MGKSQQTSSQNMANQNYGTATSQGQQTQGMLQGQLTGAQQQAQQTYGQASGAYNNMLGGTGAYTPTQYASDTDANKQNQTTGGYNNPALLNQLQSSISNNISTGGLDPTQLAGLQSQYANLTANGTGGVNQPQNQDVESGYDNLISSGGISNDTADAMRRQASQGVQSVYSTAGQNLARQQAASGNVSGGETAELARQGAQSQDTAINNTNAQIGQLRQQGTEAGLSGLGGYEQASAAGQRAAVAGSQGLATAQQQGTLQGTNQLAGLGASMAQGSLTASGQQQQLDTNAANQAIQAAGGLTNLYQAQPGYVTSLVNQILQSQQITGQLTTEQSQIMAELSKNPGLFSNIMQGLGSVGGFATAMAGIG